MMMNKLKLFISRGCVLCDRVKEILQGRDYELYDIQAVDGLAEASYYGVLSTPTLIEVSEDGEEVRRLVGEDIKKWGLDGKIIEY